MGNKRITIHVATRNRHTELALLIQSLRTQTYTAWDIVIIDESKLMITASHVLTHLINRIKLENHCVKIYHNPSPSGVCDARNLAIKHDYFNNDYICRLDDDVIIEPDYLEKLVNVINEGYDIASGVTPLVGTIEFKRSIKHISPIINKKILDDEGNITYYGDDCGYSYNEHAILPAHEFRSNALMKKEVADKIKYPRNLSPVGFREECFYSFKSQIAGFNIGVDTQAIAYHLVSPAGGCRFPDYADKVNSDHTYFIKWVKQKFKEGKLKWLLK